MADIPPTFIFDEVDALSDLTTALTSAERATNNQTRIAIENETALVQSFNELNAELAGFNEQRKNINTRLVERLQARSDRVDQPQAFDAISDLFDPRNSIRSIEADIQALNIESSLIDQAMEIATQKHNLTVQQSNIKQQTATGVVAAKKDIAITKAQFLEMGMKIEDEVQDEQLQALDNMPLEQLENFASDFSKAPAAVQQIQGAVTAIIQKKRLARANVSMQEFSAQIQLINAQTRKQQNILDNSTDNDLASMLQDPQRRPSGLSQQSVIKERTNRATQKLAGQKAGQAIQAKNNELIKEAQEQMLTTLSFEKLQGLAALAAQNPDEVVEFRGVPLNRRQLKQAADAAFTERQSSVQLKAEFGTKAAAGEATTFENQILGSNLAKEDINGTSNVIAQSDAEISILRTLRDQHDPSDPEFAIFSGKIAEAQTKLNSSLKAHQKSLMEQLPKEQRGAFEQFTTDGQVRDTSVANDFLADVADSPNVAVNSQVAPHFRELSNRFLELNQSTSFSLKETPGGFNIPVTGKKDKSVLLQQAAIDTGFVDNVGNRFSVFSIVKAINTLDQQHKAAVTPITDPSQAVGEPVPSPYEGIIDPLSGSLDARFLALDEATGQLNLNVENFIIQMSSFSRELQTKGVLRQGQNLLEPILNESIAYAERGELSNEMLGGNTTEASLNRAFFGGNVGNTVRQKLQGLQVKIPLAELRAAELEQELQNRTIGVSRQLGLGSISEAQAIADKIPSRSIKKPAPDLKTTNVIPDEKGIRDLFSSQRRAGP